MGIKPHYNVTKKIVKPKKNPFYAGKVAIIGAFDTDLTGVIKADTIDEAYSKLGTDTTYDGVKALKYLFGKGIGNHFGVTSIIAVNITTTDSTTTPPTIDKTIDPTKLSNALATIKNERFDQLFIAGIVTSDMHVTPNPEATPPVVRGGTVEPFIELIQTFTSERYTNKMPVGYSLAVSPLGSDTADIKNDYVKVMELIDDSCYGIIPAQTLKVKGVTLDGLESSAYYAGWVAGLKLDESLTTKEAPSVTGLNPEYTFENGDLGSSLLAADYMLYECYDRDESVFRLINSEQPNGLDLYITRVSDEIVRVIEFTFGQKSGVAMSECMAIMDSIKSRYVDAFNFLVDIQYHIEKEDSKTVNVVLDKLLFDDVVVVFNIPVTIEVQ